MPMLYVIQHGGNFVKEATPAENIIYLASSLISITNHGNNYYFSDGHATDNLTSFYNHKKIDDLVNIIDRGAIKAPFWGGTETLNLKRKKHAEFLVQGDIPNGTIVGYGCYNQKAIEKLLSYRINENQIKIIPNAYC